jgi:NarL family two-component system response regulator LiaR
MPAPVGPVRIAVLNDYSVIVSGVATMLEPYRDRVEVVELDNRMPVASDVDIVLFDTFAHVNGDGVDLSAVIGAGGPKVVVFSWTAHPAAVEPALALGAAGYLSKAMPAQRLVAALEEVRNGRVVVSDPRAFAVGGGPDDAPAHELGLSPREAEVLALIAKGLSNKEVAAAVFLSVNSVKTYIRSAYAKIGVHSRSQAVLWALEHGFSSRADRAFPHNGRAFPYNRGREPR